MGKVNKNHMHFSCKHTRTAILILRNIREGDVYRISNWLVESLWEIWSENKAQNLCLLLPLMWLEHSMRITRQTEHFYPCLKIITNSMTYTQC